MYDIQEVGSSSVAIVVVVVVVGIVLFIVSHDIATSG